MPARRWPHGNDWQSASGVVRKGAGVHVALCSSLVNPAWQVVHQSMVNRHPGGRADPGGPSRPRARATPRSPLIRFGCRPRDPKTPFRAATVQATGIHLCSGAAPRRTRPLGAAQSVWNPWGIGPAVWVRTQCHAIGIRGWRTGGWSVVLSPRSWLTVPLDQAARGTMMTTRRPPTGSGVPNGVWRCGRRSSMPVVPNARSVMPCSRRRARMVLGNRTRVRGRGAPGGASGAWRPPRQGWDCARGQGRRPRRDPGPQGPGSCAWHCHGTGVRDGAGVKWTVLAKDSAETGSGKDHGINQPMIAGHYTQPFLVVIPDGDGARRLVWPCGECMKRSTAHLPASECRTGSWGQWLAAARAAATPIAMDQGSLPRAGSPIGQVIWRVASSV